MDLKETIEATFGIVIRDDEAETVVTVGQLYELIQRHITYAPLEAVDICVSARAFHQFRTALVEVFDVPRSRVVLSARMDEIVPRGFRSVHWRRLGRRLGWRLPRLRALGWMTYVLIPLIPCLLPMGLLGTYIGWTGFHGLPPGAGDLLAFVSLFAVPATFALFFLSMRAVSYEFDASCENIDNMVLQCYQMNYRTIRGSVGAWSGPDEVWETLIEIFNLSYGVPVETITKGARIVSDLGVGIED